MNLLITTAFAHVISDFLIQSKNTVCEKTQFKLKGFIRHFFEVFITLIIILIFHYNFPDIILYTLLISALHIAIDILKVYIETKTKYKAKLFLFDQFLHIVLVAFIIIFFNIDFVTNSYFDRTALVFADISLINSSKQFIVDILPKIELTGLVYILFSVGAGVFIGNFLIPFKKGLDEDESSINTGKYIGIFERLIIITLTTLSQYGAIAFIIAAKSLARHEDLNKRGFAEYYLLGTLLSIIIAVSGGLMIKYGWRLI